MESEEPKFDRLCKQLFINKGSNEDENKQTDLKMFTKSKLRLGGSTATTNTDEPMEEEDNSRSEATFTFKITGVTNFFSLKDNRLSEPCYVRNLPWKIMAMPRFAPDRQSKSLGFFLQCNGESESINWSCNASAELRLLSQQPGIPPMTRNIDHHFYSKENDWGFTQFIQEKDVLDETKGYCKDDSIILQVYVKAEVPHGIQWDSKKYTGFVGLKNQGMFF